MQKNYFVYFKNDKKRKDIKARVQYRSRPRKSKRLLTMPPRNRILLEQRERIIRAFEDVHENYLMATEAYRDNRSEQEMYKKKELLKDHVEAQTMSDSTMR